MARIRVVTLNMEQDHKRWAARRELIVGELAALEPDVVALNEVCMPRQSARWVQRAVEERLNVEYALVQQTQSNSLSAVEGEALLSRYPLRETGNLDYETRDMVALVARLDLDSRRDVTARIVCGDFNATLDKPSAALMATRFRHTQIAPTAFTPLAGDDGAISHPYWARMDRCIDYIWVSEE